MSIDWMPIETAPHDTRILVYSNSGGTDIGIYCPVIKNWYISDYSEAGPIEPTERQPLPPPPAQKKKVDKQT